MITSSSNAQVKNVIQLNKKGKARKEQGLFVVEGIKMFREAPVDWIEKVYIRESLYEGGFKKLLADIPHEVVADQVFRQMSDTKTPQGILTLIRQPVYVWRDLVKKKAPLLVVLEDLQDPGNLGTILRTGEGAGVDGVVMNRGCVDIFNPKTIRSTMGSIYRMPFLYMDNMVQLMESLRTEGICTYAAHLSGKNAYDREDYRKGTAFLIGNEGNGLSEKLTSLAQRLIRIPMDGEVESLNAAMACGILTYEAARQRRNS